MVIYFCFCMYSGKRYLASVIEGTRWPGKGAPTKNEEARLCRPHASRIADTSNGPIEYAMQGEGPAVLVIHGCPGGYDQGLVAARLTRDPSFKFIAPSRPGYLRTPLKVGRTPEAQAD